MRFLLHTSCWKNAVPHQADPTCRSLRIQWAEKRCRACLPASSPKGACFPTPARSVCRARCTPASEEQFLRLLQHHTKPTNVMISEKWVLFFCSIFKVSNYVFGRVLGILSSVKSERQGNVHILSCVCVGVAPCMQWGLSMLMLAGQGGQQQELRTHCSQTRTGSALLESSHGTCLQHWEEKYYQISMCIAALFVRATIEAQMFFTRMNR